MPTSRLPLLLWVAAVCLGADATAAPRNDHKADEDERPTGEWARLPTGAERTYAITALKQAGIGGRGVVRCAVGDQGELMSCRMAQETPVGSGWGKATLALAEKYRRKPPGPKSLREITIVEAWYPMDKLPDWLRKPTPSDLLAVFPSEAYKRGQSGKAVLSCVNTAQGKLTDCIAIDESPAGAGFGAAAIALTPQFLMRPGQLAGKPVVSVIRMPINFIMDGAPGPSLGSKKVLPANIAWSDAPTYADVAAAFPKKARDERRGGRVTLACGMNDEGRLKDCTVATSDPKGYGFDSAAKTLARRFALPVASEADRKAARSVVIHLPITFDPATLDAAEPVVGKPNWAAIPDDARIRAAFAGVKATGTARVGLSCLVQAGGGLSNCSVSSESPEGAGLGAAALSLAPTFRVSTWTADGLPVVGGRIRIPLRYEGPPPAAAQVPAQPVAASPSAP